MKRLIAELSVEFRRQLPDSDEKFCHGKPLTVGGFSNDPDTRSGKLPGNGWGRGYKVQVLVDACGAVDLFTVTALNAGEPTVMCHLVELADLDRKIIRADSNYDSNRLYAAVAKRGGRLIASRKKPGMWLGHGQHHPHRLLAIHALEQSSESMRAHRRHHIRAEQALGHVTNISLWPESTAQLWSPPAPGGAVCAGEDHGISSVSRTHAPPSRSRLNAKRCFEGEGTRGTNSRMQSRL